MGQQAQTFLPSLYARIWLTVLSLCFKIKLPWLVTEMACDLNGYTYSQILCLLSSPYPKICSRKWKVAESLHTLCTLLGTYKKQSCNLPRNGWSSQSAMKILISACPSTSQSADAATEQPGKKKKSSLPQLDEVFSNETLHRFGGCKYCETELFTSLYLPLGILAFCPACGFV